MSKKKRLGRGLEALLGVGGQKDSTAENQSGENQSKDEIDPGRISPVSYTHLRAHET